jgi:hypothetical protein
MSGEGPIFTNHVDKARIIKREVMPKVLQDKSKTSSNLAMDAVVFFNFRAVQKCTNEENEIFRSSMKFPFQLIKN